MLLINPENEYPRHIGDLKLANPNWKVGDELPAGWREVAYAADRPLAGEDEFIYETFPTEVDGVLTQTFAVRPMTAEEIERRDAPIRAKAKLEEAGFSDAEIEAIKRGLVY